MILLLTCVIANKQYCQPLYKNSKIPLGYSLEYAALIFKHGLRAPLDKIPGFETVWNCSGDNWIYPGGDAHSEDRKFLHQFKIKPIESQSFLRGGCRAGEILDTGIEQMKKLAEHIKVVYSSLIPSNFEKRTVGFRSTYTNRCLASLQIIAHYLFSGSEPIETFVSNEELETLIPNPYLCPALSDVMNITQSKNNSFYYQLKNFSSKLEKIKENSSIFAVPHWMRIPELMTTHECTDASLPPGFNESLLNESVELFTNFYSNVLNDDKGRKYGSGLLISDINSWIRDYLTGASENKMSFVSGHTLTLISLYASLNLPISFPAYGSYVAFELLKHNSKYFIRVTNNGEEVKMMKYNEFQALVSSIRPEEKQCRIKYPFVEKDKKAPGTKILQMSFS